MKEVSDAKDWPNQTRPGQAGRDQNALMETARLPSFVDFLISFVFWRLMFNSALDCPSVCSFVYGSGDDGDVKHHFLVFNYRTNVRRLKYYMFNILALSAGIPSFDFRTPKNSQ